ncbi:MAG: glycine betaine ABC transporter substrate-binding protein [Phycisphaerae bacterium]
MRSLMFSMRRTILLTDRTRHAARRLAGGWWILVVMCLPARLSVADDTITVGSKSFTENRILGEAMAQELESKTNLNVIRRINLGGTMIVGSALKSGEIDVYAEYTGTGWAIHLGLTEKVTNPLRAYVHVREEYLKRFGIVWLQPFGFANNYALAVRESMANDLNLERVSDLLPHMGSLTAGFTLEFLNREDGFLGLKKAYGLKFADVKGLEHGLLYTALDAGQVDLMETYTTDGKLQKFKVKLLEDDRQFFPPYDCAPIVRQDVIVAHPEVNEVLSQFAFRISDTLMQEMNYAVELEGKSYEDVARELRQRLGLIDTPLASHQKDDQDSASLSDFIATQGPATLQHTIDHLLLTGQAVVLAVLFAIPLGILLTRYPSLAGPVLGVTGIIQTIPSLALLAFFIPVLGLGVPSAIAALFLYALLPIVRNTYTGIRNVDPHLIEAARGMGMRDLEILRLVEIPLAARTVMAGIRTATVISVGVATLAAFIGAGGLGQPIVTGLQLNRTSLVLSGAIPAGVLAVLLDFLLARIESRLTRIKTA